MRRISPLSAIAILAAALVSFTVYAQNAAAPPVAPGLVAANMIGRLVVDPDGAGELVGYYLSLQGIAGALFSDTTNISEQTAYFTFRSSRFSVTPISNGPLIHLRAMPAGGDTAIFLSVYYNATPSQDFSDPDSFSAGTLIGQFQAQGGLATIVPFSSTTYVGSFNAVTTPDFMFGSNSYNLGQLASNITVQLNGAPYDVELGYGTASIPFGGSALAAANYVPTAVNPIGNSQPRPHGDGK